VAELRARLSEGGRLAKLIDKTFELAMAGDPAAIRIILDRVLPALRAQAAPVHVDLTGATPTQQARALVAAAARGDIPSDVAAEMVGMLAKVALIEQVDEMRHQLDQLRFGDWA
jgi:hypothetical protein